MKTFISCTCAALLVCALALPTAAVSQPFIELVGTDVTLDETEFTYTGGEIRPNITVRSNGKLLTLDEHYSLDYTDNIAVGEAKVIVTGISENGYAGTVEHPFFIREAVTEPEQPETEATPPETEPTQPETEPAEPTVPETEPTQPETSAPSEPAKPEYTITKGSKSSWTQGSQAALSFTADGPFADFEGVSVDGKQLEKTQFEAKEGTVVLLSNAFLKTLQTGSHTIAIHFAEADAEGTFTVAAADENPKTGDAIALWLAAMTAAGTSLLLLKKKTA